MPWQEIIKFLGGSAIFAAFFGFLGKVAIEAFVKGRVEVFKKDLQIATTEHSIRFQSLHGERASVIKEFYKHLINLDESLHSSLRGFRLQNEPSIESEVDKLAVNYNLLREYYLPNRIYFDKEVCEKIETIIEIARGIFFKITTLPVDPQIVKENYDKDVLLERHKFWEEAREIHKNEITQLKANLEENFRAILGINT